MSSNKLVKLLHLVG